MKTIAKYGLILFMAFFCAGVSFGYEVWFGLPYIPKGSADRLDEWGIVAEKLEGMNTNAVDGQRPDAERNTAAEWKAIVQSMPTAKNNAVLEFARTHFEYDGLYGDSRDPLPDVLTVKFRKESKLGCTIKWVMPFDNQPKEDRTLPVEEWSEQDLQGMRDWLDNNGHADVKILSLVRNNGARSRTFSKSPLVDGISIEAKAELWFENNGSRQDYLKWALEEPLVKDKHFKFQVPYNWNGSDTGFQGMREFMRWLSTSDMLGSTDFIRRDDVTFMVITYSDNFPFLPETSNDGTQYQATLFSTALSIIEQRDLFEGRGPDGLISLEQALSYQRNGFSAAPTSGLVAHWPLDEGTGTVASDASGYGFDGDLLNGVTWGSDTERGTYAVFDGTDDRIATTFKYALAATNDFTWAWWAKKEPTSHPSSIMVGNRYGNTGSESLEFIKMMPSKGSFANTGSASSIENYDYADIAASSWHHYAMVKNGTSYQWYVDGAAQGSPVTISYSETSPLPFLIGGDDDGSGTKVNEHFEGGIDDVVLYREALTQPEIDDVINGIYIPIITLATLGTPVDSTEPTAWSDGNAPHSGADYVIPDTGNVRGESGTTTFPGNKLTVEAGGKYQVRSLKSSSQIGTVDHLVLEGDADFTADVALLVAGTGSDETNVLDGNLINSGSTRLVTYGGTINRSLEILSNVSGTGQLRAGGGATVTIDNAANTFAGTWQVDTGSTLQFNSAEAIGAADIDVLAGGTLKISESGTIETTLTVADASATSVDLGGNGWVVSNLVFGGSSVADGLYSATELNALGTHTVFTGLGTLRIGARNPEEPVAHWKLDEGTGTAVSDSSGSGYTGSILNGATWGSDASRSSFISFDGTDDRISTPFTYALSASDNFTWAWWAKKAPTTHANSIMVGNRYGNTGTESLEFIKFMPNQAQFSNTGDAANIEAYDYTDLPNDEWHHYAMVKTGTSYQWYVDGVAEGAPESFTYSETSPLPFLMGGDGDDKPNEHFEGSIDDVVLYDQSLSSAELNYVKNGIYFDFPDNNEPPSMQVDLVDGAFSFSWIEGGFKLQSCTNLTDGGWFDHESGGLSPVTIAPTSGSAFFRLIEN